MKLCKKCNKIYNNKKRDCPNCGKFSDNKSILFKVINVILYIIGSFILLINLLLMKDYPISSIIGILFGLSFFSIIYTLINKKVSIKKIFLIILRVVSPIILFIIWVIIFPGEDSSSNSEEFNASNGDIKTVCFYKSDEDVEGIIKKENYIFIYRGKKRNFSESLTKYTFKSEDLAYNYYINHVNELTEHNNKIHLLYKVMDVYHYTPHDNSTGSSVMLNLYKETGYDCYDNDSFMIDKFNSLKDKYDSESEKSEEFLKSKNNSSNTDTTINDKENTDLENDKQSSDDFSYMDVLRKCSVMEAADIYTTGGNSKTGNFFNDGRITCESFYSHWGEKEFIETVNADWDNRRNEKIDGKPLSYYLGILGW